jgi:hypothetical protein
MALKKVRIGALEDAFQYDDGDFATPIEADDPIVATDFDATSMKSGATQAAAGAAAGELWSTSGHGSLPDHVVMRGV